MTTSLVFLVVLGIWAAYLVQQWKRRREHLLTARSVDAFTEALRVLERRPAVPSTTPERARSRAAGPLGSIGAAPAPQGAPASTRTAVRPSVLRGLSLAVAGILLVATVVVAALHLVGWYVPVAALGLLVADIAYLRWTTTLARRAHAAARASAEPGEVPAARPVAPREVAVSGPVTEVIAPVAMPEGVAPAETPSDEVVVDEVVVGEAVASAPQALAPVLFDIRAFDEKAGADPLMAVATDDAQVEAPEPGVWSPTPVPAPLYTRKAVVDQPVAVVHPVVLPESDTVLTPVVVDEVLEVESPYSGYATYPQVVNG